MASFFSDPVLLASLSWREIEDLFCYEQLRRPRQREFRSRRGLLSFTNMKDETFHQQFRFEKDDLGRLCRLLQVSDPLEIRQGISVSANEALCIGLRRLAYPNRLCDMEEIFGRHSSTISLISNEIVQHIAVTFKHLLEDMPSHTWLNLENLSTFSRAVHAKGAPLQNCWGFIDGTARPICRPSVDQQEYFSGHKRVHALKYQSVMCANGIICELDGPYVGRRHDAGILRESQLYEKLERVVQGEDFVVYGDPAYPLRPLLCRPYAGAVLTEAQRQFNSSMSTVRQAVEWGFGNVTSLFAFGDFKKNQKLLLQRVPEMYKAAVILTNCHTCLYGNQTSLFFGLQPPQLEDYLRPSP